MPYFSERSRTNLETCHTDLQRVFNVVINFYDCTILEGHRTEYDQNKYFDEGKSKLQWPDSKHNKMPSLAVDAVPYPIDWQDKRRFYHFAGFVLGVASMMGIKLRCGIDWDGDFSFKDQSFHDYPHFELVKGE
jgi:peptidoglycan L-alanyl-D-glutamate endopeptidase CwlK